MLLWISRIFAFIPLSIIHPTSVKGKKNLPKGKAILCCNHLSNWDMVLYYLNTSQHLKVLAKKEVFESKIGGWYLKKLGGIPIDRDGNDINAIKECMKALKKDKKLFIFPEGTRLKDDKEMLGEIKSGLALIAIKTRTPIVPIWIKSRPRLFRRSVYCIGKPFELSQFYDQKLDEQTLEKANEFVREKMLEQRELSMHRNKKLKKKKKV